eukprot:TRINITY_DN3169_c0_g1_i1.p1 TRINITY_DN3169_c0_g1~~TRINITY_DN3169_c0_g1_i1.p1  ORF type:complete len:533 (+),score=135.59 TRINITY_DN3169_c0_g1_i1:59-1657(+)
MALMAPPTSAVLQEGAFEEKGEMARMYYFVGAIEIADMVKTTLGPKGMDKILQSVTSREAGIQVTNDGATILKSVIVENPAAKVLIDIAKTQDDEVGDGTTSVCVFAGELLREAEKLVMQKIHPQTIIQGWHMATKVARDALTKAAIDHSQDEAKWREDLMNVSRTTLSSKILQNAKDHFAKLAVDAVMRIKVTGNLDHIQILKKPGGTLKDSYLDAGGFILDKKIGVGQPKRLENAKILVANTAMDTDKVKIYTTRVRVDALNKVADIEEAEKRKMREKVEKILAHGCNCFINRQLIYNFPEQLFADAGVMGIEHADFEGIELLASVLGADIASTFDSPEGTTLGRCDVIEEVMIGESKVIRFGGVPVGDACTVVLRGAGAHVLDEAERSLHDALCVLNGMVKEHKTVYGGGCSEVLMAKAVDDLAAKTPGKKALAIEAYARALRQIPSIIADNGGYDSAELVSQLRAEHYKGNALAGLDMADGSIGNMQELGITESYKVKLQVLLSGAEAAEMILRVDDVVKLPPRRREG